MFSLDALLQALHPDRKFPDWQRYLLRKLVYEKAFQQIADDYPHLKGLDLIEQVINDFNIHCELSHSDLENIPAQGPVVLVANHPIGSLDALVLLQTVAKVRPDVKVMTTPLLSYLEPLRSLFISVDNINHRTHRRQIHEVMTHLTNQHALIIFPAGEVSRLSLTGIQDGPWLSGFLRLAAKVNAPIVPVHIQARNSALFYTASLFYRPLSTLLLVRELFTHQNAQLKLKIGRRISFHRWHSHQYDDKALAERFRQHVYRLAKGKEGLFETEAPIALAENRTQLRKALTLCEVLGITPDNKIIYLYRRGEDIDSPVLRELGRLREIAFRAVGEGSGHRRDLDKYDDNYCHLVLWDDAELEIVGAYRFIATAKQISEKGIEGIYTHIFFDYDDSMKPILAQGIELGRSFIQPKYWGKRGLDYLWLGIGAYLAKYPQYRYLFGPVSISGDMPKAGRDLLVAFYRLYFSQPNPSATSRSPYPPSLPQVLAQFSGKDYANDLVKLKSLLGNLGCSIPTLYKQYAELCEPGGVQFLDFGIDDAFNSIDGLVLVDISQLKPSRYQRYIAVHQKPTESTS
ncbi:lysophospholipid acyltransferase family protein [Pragia fontium]|uniref:lysophospholipid acyltransferase family protein n=1 Tax=Pragia fontium TaxID=82985 RepID=UPI0006494997|nr:GNAT family N-acyltransferase [Pragia fontium]AKJ42337.1 acyltransferase [Pragia fontium]